MKSWLLIVIAFALVGAGWLVGRTGRADIAPVETTALAQAGDEKPDPAEAEVRPIGSAIAKAFAAGDAKAMAALWTEKGEYSDGDETLRGRKAIEKAYADFFAKNKGNTIDLAPGKIRFLSSNSATAEGTFTRKSPEGKVMATSQYSLLLVKEDKKWMIAVAREWARDEVATLKDVDWLVGEWTSKSGDAEVHTVFAYDENKAFLHGRFTMKEKGKTVRSGLQIIGQDASEGVLRSWVFDSAGGFGGGVWEADGKGWKIVSAGVLPDGSTTASVNVFQKIDNDSFTWHSAERAQDGLPQPDTIPLKVTRVKKGK